MIKLFIEFFFLTEHHKVAHILTPLKLPVFNYALLMPVTILRPTLVFVSYEYNISIYVRDTAPTPEKKQQQKKKFFSLTIERH